MVGSAPGRPSPAHTGPEPFPVGPATVGVSAMEGPHDDADEAPDVETERGFGELGVLFVIVWLVIVGGTLSLLEQVDAAIVVLLPIVGAVLAILVVYGLVRLDRRRRA